MPERAGESPPMAGARLRDQAPLPSRIRELPLRIVPLAMLATRRSGIGGRGSIHLIERHARVYRHTWTVLISGFFEPLFYLLSIGIGLGKLVGTVDGVGFTSFVAPALLAS